MFAKLNNMNVGNKIYGIIGMCMVGLVGISGLSIYKMNQIGGEIEGIAERDIPLTEILTKITVHQLEQTVALERALRYGETMGHSQLAAANFGESVDKFHELSALTDEEIITGEELAAVAIEHAQSDAERQEYQHVLDALKQIETEHKSFDLHANEVLDLLAQGYVNEAVEKETLVEEEAAKLEHELTALLTEIETFTLQAAETAEAHEKTALMIMIVSALIVIAFSWVVSWFVVRRSLSIPLREVVEALEAITKGDTSVEVVVHAEDEVGAVAKAIQVFKDNVIETERMRKQAEEREKNAEAEKKKQMAELADSFEATVAGVVETVASASTELQATAQQMTSTAEQTNSRSITVATASEQASSNVQTVATATEELTASISEISRQITESNKIAQQAVRDADHTNESVNALAEAGQKIGEVVNLIQDIAEQTNLLALNATIEAARAGEAGKGFAVVANEVKSLASQTAKATQEIGEQVEGMQSATKSTVTSIGEITQVIRQISETATTIASAVEEQNAATEEISRSVQEAARGTQDVATNISDVTKAAEETGSAAGNVLESAGGLSEQSETLRKEVEKFVGDLRAA